MAAMEADGEVLLHLRPAQQVEADGRSPRASRKPDYIQKAGRRAVAKTPLPATCFRPVGVEAAAPARPTPDSHLVYTGASKTGIHTRCPKRLRVRAAWRTAHFLSWLDRSDES